MNKHSQNRKMTNLNFFLYNIYCLPPTHPHTHTQLLNEREIYDHIDRFT